MKFYVNSEDDKCLCIANDKLCAYYDLSLRDDNGNLTVNILPVITLYGHMFAVMCPLIRMLFGEDIGIHDMNNIIIDKLTHDYAYCAGKRKYAVKLENSSYNRMVFDAPVNGELTANLWSTDPDDLKESFKFDVNYIASKDYNHNENGIAGLVIKTLTGITYHDGSTAEFTQDLAFVPINDNWDVEEFEA